MRIDNTTTKTALVRMGWDDKGDKHPQFLETWRDATVKTKETIEAHFNQYQDAGIALLTGREAGFTVIDFDTKDNPLFAELFKECPTYWVRTRKGFHLYYRYLPQLKQGTDRFGRGVDIRNDGGVVFAPPTKNYEGSDDDIAELNDDGKRILEAAYTASAKPVAKELKTTETRNDTLFRKACGWINIYSEQETWNKMVKANAAFTKGELDDKELETLFQQVKQYDPNEKVKKEEKKKVNGVSIDDLDLVKSAEGKTIKCVENAARLLERHPDFKGRLRFDEFAQDPQIFENGEWRRITDDDYTNIQRRAQSMYQHFATYGLELFTQAVMSVTSQHRVDSAKDWVNGLKWDNVQRIEEFCMKAYGVEDTVYHRAVGKNFLLGMAARILIPGCHHRSVLILEGPQNSKKSKSFRTLVGEKWFLEDAPLNVENVSFHMSLWGKLIVEFSEGVIFSKIDMGKLKGLVSTPSDTIVKKWGKTPIDMKRRCVFVITTNQNQYFSDTTGNTRFFPVVIKSIDLEFIEKNRDQLFAEAAARIRMGEQWWDDDEEITKMNTEEQESRISVSILEEIIDEWLSSKRSQPAIEEGFQTKIFFETMTKDGEKRLRHFSPGEAREVAAILRKKGFFQKVYKIDGYCLKLWKKV